MNLELVVTDDLLKELKSRYRTVVFCGVYDKPPDEHGNYVLRMLWEGYKHEGHYALQVMAHFIDDDDIAITKLPDDEVV